jgi:pimeloyl-ACP methyl ester carboxylesterase
MTDTTYILVHGGWGGAWCWRDLGTELTARGVKWSAVDLPSSTHGAHPNTYLHDDAREVVAVAELDGPVVLVGHSYGGSVITEAAEKIPNLERLVYVAALLPYLGESSTEANYALPVRTHLDEAILIDGDFFRLDPERVITALYQDCESDVANWAVSQLTMQTIASFRSPRSAFDADVPSFYIRCAEDNAVHPDVQAVMAERCRDSVTIDSGHSPMFSRPSTLCDLIVQE